MKKIDPYKIYLITVSASSFLFSAAFTTSGIYRFTMAELNPLQLVLLGTFLEGSVFLFEIPTGVVADIYSRRLSVIIGYTLIGMGMLLEGSFQIFFTILAAQVAWGIGYTFISGAQDAWLADEIGEKQLTPAYLRASQFSQVAALAGIAINIAFASIQLNLPFFIGGIGHIALAIFLAFFMPENKFNPADQTERQTWQKMGSTFQNGMKTIRKSALMVTIMGIAFVYGLYSEALDRLWEAHIIDNFTLPTIGSFETVVWFGIINATIMVVTILTTEFVRRRSEKWGQNRMVQLLAMFSGVMSIGLMLFGLASGFAMAITSYGFVAITRRTMQPLYSAWVNRDIPSNVRATVLSTYGQMDAVGQFIGGPAIGAAATQVGLRAAMVLSGSLLALVLPLYWRAYRIIQRKSPVQQP